MKSAVFNKMLGLMRHVSLPFIFYLIPFTFYLLPFHSLYAQQPWNFTSVEELSTADAYIVEPPADVKAAIEKSGAKTMQFNCRYHISGPHTTILGRQYYLFTPLQPSTFNLQSPTAYQLPVSVAQQLLPHIVDTRYWEQRFAKLLSWAYVDMERLGSLIDVDTTDNRFGRYCPIRWLGYTFQPSEQWPVIFTVSTNTRTPQSLTLRAMERLAEWGAFATEADQLAYEQHEDALADSLLALDSHLSTIDSQLSTINDQLSTFIDSITLQLRSDSIAEREELTRAEVERTKERMNRDEIFIMNIKPARSNYMFGIELNLYNCYERTISMIELSVAPYNERDRIQEDKFHRSVRTMRCMGPIRPGHPAQYTFDELFWDDRGKIKYMRLTSITFHFTDGTTKHFAGYQKILRHSLK